jgi:hypothetical protein
MKQQAADNCSLYSDAPEMVKVARDINTGVKRFQNAARRYWTRAEKKTSLKANQMYYQFPSDMLRVSTVKIKNGDRYVPITQIRSEEQWNRLGTSPGFSANNAMYYFVKGADEVGIYPVPTTNVTDGMIVSFEPRMVDMMIEDVKMKADVIENSVIITANAGTFTPKVANNCWFTTTDGLDGNWYKVSKYIDSTHLWIDNVFQGPTATNVDILIGQCPPFPEEYHDAPVYYACHQFFLMRKDLESASMYKQLFDAAFAEYKQVYGNKTTGGVINPNARAGSSFDPFGGVLVG